MCKVNLEDCCEILDSKRVPITATNRKSGPYPYYGANGIQDYVDDYIFDEELVLLAEDGGNFNSTTKPIAYRVSGKCWVNNHAHVLKPLPIIDVDYLCYSLMFYKVGNLVNGATREKLTQAAMRKMQVHLRPMPEQINIVSTLRKTQSIIAYRRAQLAKLDELVKCRFVEMFGDPVLNEKGWTCSQLGDVANVIGGYAFSSKQFAAAGIPVLRIGNINTGTFRKENLVFWSEDEKLTKYLIYPGDIVISLTGTAGKEDYGNVCVMSDDYPKYYLNQRNAVIRPTSCLLPSFLSYYMKSPVIKRKMTGIERGIRQGNISNSDITSLRIPMPPIYLQENFTHMVHLIDKLRFVIQKSLDETQKLFDSLMQEYFD